MVFMAGRIWQSLFLKKCILNEGGAGNVDTNDGSDMRFMFYADKDHLQTTP
jgi:hypothetical protein